jgi:hypothetical protein
MPPPSQELLDARTAVNEVISKSVTSDEAARIVKDWHHQVKVWEESDVLDQAFKDSRLTFRYMIHPDKGVDKFGATDKYDFKKENPGKDPTRERILGIINNDRYQKDVTNRGVKEKIVDDNGKEDSVWVRGASRGGKITLDAGGAGMLRRMDPANFERTAQTQSNKHAMGLHSLSASLLNPEGYSGHRFSEIALVCLMPLPLQDDVTIFYGLRQLSKSGGSGSFQAAVVTLASEFTRPQLAAGMDMGAQYVLVTSERHKKDSVKYVRGTKNQDQEGQTPRLGRLNARNDYKAILKSGVGNEITIAYRKHGLSGTKFPVFAIGLPGADDYKEVLITIPQQDPPRKYGSPPPRKFPSYTETGRTIDGATFKFKEKG